MREQETEERILAAARVVFLRRGMSGARTQEIADEAGVNKALLHYYFRSKERLALTVFRRAIAQVLPRVHSILRSDVSVEQKIEDLISAELEFLTEHPYLPGYVISEINYHPEFVLQAFGERGPAPIEKLQSQLDDEAAAGRIRPISAEQFVANLMSLILFPFVARPLLGVMLGLEGERFTAFIEERKVILKDLVLRGLRP